MLYVYYVCHSNNSPSICKYCILLVTISLLELVMNLVSWVSLLCFVKDICCTCTELPISTALYGTNKWFILYYEMIFIIYIVCSDEIHITVFPVKPWTPEKISGMFIVSRPIRCEMKPQKITTNCSWDQSRLDTKQQARLSSARNLQFSLCISIYFYHKPKLVTWFRLFKNQTTEPT